MAKTPALKSTFSTHDSPPPVYRHSQVNATPVTTSSSTTTNSDHASTNGSANQKSAYEKRQSTMSTSSSTSSENKFNFGVSEKCARCQKSVYAAEKIIAASKSYHKLCFTCSTCKKSLSSMSCCDNSDGDIFCKGNSSSFSKRPSFALTLNKNRHEFDHFVFDSFFF